MFYYDSVKIFPDDKLEEAIEFGKQNGQLAIILADQTAGNPAVN